MRNDCLLARLFLASVAGFILGQFPSYANGEALPAILSDWWQVAGNPNVDPYTTANQQPVDFGIWQDANGNWRIWSCIRRTSYPGNTRLFHGWESSDLFASNWTPTGIEMTSVTALGEVNGGLQAPYVFREDDTYHMLYGTWNHIARATSSDGENFSRVIQGNGTTNLFGTGETNPRDVMVIKQADTYYAYYTAHTNSEGKDYLRTSTDLDNWSAAQVVAFGGSASGTGSFSAECPFVYFDEASEAFYLFRTQRYGTNARTNIYRSTDPTYFGVGADADNYYVGSLPVAAPEIFDFEGKTYMAALNPGLDGIQIAEFGFVIPPDSPPIVAPGGKWQVTERRINTGAAGAFVIDSVADATALLNLPANDPRIIANHSFESSVINFNHSTGDIGHFGDDVPLPGGNSGNDIAIRVQGEFRLLQSGPITFGLTVNDGAVLRINNQQVILDNVADAVSDSFGTIELEAGLHNLEVVFFQRNFSSVLELFVANEVGTFTQFVGVDAPSTFWSLIEAAPLPGDYDHDGDVDEADYSKWVSTFGATGNQPADGNADGVVSAADYVIWRDHLPGSGALAETTSVPEPPSLIIANTVACLMVWVTQFLRKSAINKLFRKCEHTS